MDSLILSHYDREFLAGTVDERECVSQEDMAQSVGFLEPDYSEHPDGVPLRVFYKDGKRMSRLSVLEAANRRTFHTTAQ